MRARSVPSAASHVNADPHGVTGEQAGQGGVASAEPVFPDKGPDRPDGDRLEVGFGRRRSAVGRHRRP